MKDATAHLARRAIRALCLLLFAVSAGGSAAASQTPAERADTRPVLFVGNNWDGTAHIVDPRTFKKLAHINVVPDLDERRAEIAADPRKLGYYIAIRAAVGEGNDQYVDDMFSSQDGRSMYVSRRSLADVVGIDIKTGKIIWRMPMEGYRSDHMAISPDGTRRSSRTRQRARFM